MTMATAPVKAALAVNGWPIYAHPVFLDQFGGLAEEVEARTVRAPTNWKKKNCAKRLAAIFKLVTEAQENVSLAKRKQEVRIQLGDTMVRDL